MLQTSVVGTSPTPEPFGVRVRQWASDRKWPLLVLAAVVLSGMAYTFFWASLTHKGSFWIVPGDIWGTFRSAHYIAWGDIGDVYSHETGLVTLPGISLVLAPVAFITYHLRLTESFPNGIAHPTAWLLLGPSEIIAGALILFPLDRLAAAVGVVRRSRAWLSLAEGVVLWPMLVIWGHPEDALAMAFAVFGLLAALRSDWRSTGWWFGLALVTQPLVVLIVPIVIAYAPIHRWPRLAVKMAVPTIALVSIPLIQQWAQTSRALFQQPNYPTVDHATPWLAFAPVLSRAQPAVSQHLLQKTVSHRSEFTILTHHTIAGEVVASGPGRTIAIGLAVLIGVWVMRHRPSAVQIVWLAGLALALRCVFEAVMDPYYLWAPLAIILVLSARDWRRFLVSIASAAAMTVWSYRHTGPWAWWLPIVLLLAVGLVSAYPRVARRNPPETAVAADIELNQRARVLVNSG